MFLFSSVIRFFCFFPFSVQVFILLQFILLSPTTGMTHFLCFDLYIMSRSHIGILSCASSPHIFAISFFLFFFSSPPFSEYDQAVKRGGSGRSESEVITQGLSNFLLFSSKTTQFSETIRSKILTVLFWPVCKLSRFERRPKSVLFKLGN